MSEEQEYPLGVLVFGIYDTPDGSGQTVTLYRTQQNSVLVQGEYLPAVPLAPSELRSTAERLMQAAESIDDLIALGLREASYKKGSSQGNNCRLDSEMTRGLALLAKSENKNLEEYIEAVLLRHLEEQRAFRKPVSLPPM